MASSPVASAIAFAGVTSAALTAWFAYQSYAQPAALVRAQSKPPTDTTLLRRRSSGDQTMTGREADGSIRQPKKIIRRYSSGDHAFLPNKGERAAKAAAEKNFGVPKDLVQDREGDRLPTTRGY